MPSCRSLGDEARKIVEYLGLNAATAQQIEQQFAPPRRFGGEQHAAATRGDVRREFRGRLLGARVDANRGRRRTREILHRPRGFGRPFEGAQLNLRPRGELRAKFLRRQVQLRGIQNRPVAVVAQLLVPLHDARATGSATEELASCMSIRTLCGGRYSNRCEVRSKNSGRKNSRPPGRLARAHIAIDRLLGQIAGEAQPIAAAEFAHGVGIERCFPRGEQLNAIQLVARALRIGIEMPDAVDIAVQQVDAVGAVRAHGEHIEQRAADREFAVGDHLRDGGVAGQASSRARSASRSSVSPTCTFSE